MSIDRDGGLLARIGEAMVAAGLSQGDLARLAGTQQPVVQRWLKGGAIPGGSALARLPRALGVSGHWLLTGEGGRMPPGMSDDAIYERGRMAGWREAIHILQSLERVTAGGAAEIPPEILALARRLIDPESNPAADRPLAPPQGDGAKG